MRFELSTTIGGNRQLSGAEFESIARGGFQTIDLSLPLGPGSLSDDRWLTEVQQAASAAGLEVGGLSAAWSLGSLALDRASSTGI
jgi:hypothetical protein